MWEPFHLLPPAKSYSCIWMVCWGKIIIYDRALSAWTVLDVHLRARWIMPCLLTIQSLRWPSWMKTSGSSKAGLLHEGRTSQELRKTTAQAGLGSYRTSTELLDWWAKGRGPRWGWLVQIRPVSVLRALTEVDILDMQGSPLYMTCQAGKC